MRSALHTALVILSVLGATAASASDFTLPRPGMLPQRPSDDQQWFDYSRSPQLWGISDPAYLRAFLKTLDRSLESIDLLDDPISEDHYELDVPYDNATGAHRQKRVFVMRLSSNALCASGSCPWLIAQNDGRRWTLAQRAAFLADQRRQANALDLAGRPEEAASRFAAFETTLIIGDPRDRTNWTHVQKLMGCSDPEERSGFRFPPGTVWPGQHVKIAKDLASVSICGIPHELNWPNR